MTWTQTLILAAAAICVGLFSGWRGSRPAEPFRHPRLAPWNFLLAVSAAVLLYAVVHMVNLAGVHTGRY